jgi:hypothetical protein
VKADFVVIFIFTGNSHITPNSKGITVRGVKRVTGLIQLQMDWQVRVSEFLWNVSPESTLGIALASRRQIHGWYPALRCDAADEEKKQLSYFGSMLPREPIQEEEDFQKMVDAVEEHGMMIKGKIVKPSSSSGSTTPPG